MIHSSLQNAVKKFLVSLPVACALTLPAIAHADENTDCPPGSWFCDNTQAPPVGTSQNLQPLPGNDTPAEKAAEPQAFAPRPPPPPVIVYQPAPPPPTTVIVQPRRPPPPYYYTPRRPPPPTEWGLNLHVGGLMLSNPYDNNTVGMGLAGVGLRFRPVPVFALEADLDFVGGRDFDDFLRTETALSLHGLIFLNPRDMTQVYLVGGFGWSNARITDDRTSPYIDYEYRSSYFGVQGGIGLEFRLSRTVALNIDVRGMVRARIDRDRNSHPEFVDSNGRSTNTSGVGTLQGGLTFYW